MITLNPDQRVGIGKALFSYRYTRRMKQSVAAEHFHISVNILTKLENFRAIKVRPALILQIMDEMEETKKLGIDIMPDHT